MRDTSVMPVAYAAPATDYLRIALLISACVHAAVLAIHWSSPTAPRPPEPSLEVVLVNAHTPTAPVAPTVLAQQQIDGGGEADAGHAATPLPHTGALSPDEMVLEALRQRQAALEAEQARLFALLQASVQANAGDPQSEPLPRADAPGVDDMDQDSLLSNARIAALKDRVDTYNARPRRTFVGPAAANADHAAYVEQWRERIERLGTEHYPEQARGQIYGSLQLTVHIWKDGSLERVEVDRPSEHAILNLAAQRIVRLAAPFPPLPEAIARTTDILVITRTWHFIDNRLDTAP